MKLLVCGGAGFIGSCFVRRRLAATDDSIVVLDKLTYAGNRANLAAAESDRRLGQRLTFVRGDICDAAVVRPLVADADAVVNFAAESHVDRSILEPDDCVRTGILGVMVLIEAVRDVQDRRPIRLVQVSTDEVYGPVEAGLSVETDTVSPRSTYATVKAAGELLVRSYAMTHGLDAVITRGANTYGPYQHPEKLIPLFITNALTDRPLPLYGDGLQQRDWLHVDDHADAIGHVLDHGRTAMTYNIAADQLRTNRAVAARLLERLGKPWALVRSVPDRPGHDLRYAMSGALLADIGWRPSIAFDEGLPATVAWYVENEEWWRAARSADWLDYYERQYGWRLAASTPA